MVNPICSRGRIPPPVSRAEISSNCSAEEEKTGVKNPPGNWGPKSRNTKARKVVPTHKRATHNSCWPKPKRRLPKRRLIPVASAFFPKDADFLTNAFAWSVTPGATRPLNSPKAPIIEGREVPFAGAPLRS